MLMPVLLACGLYLGIVYPISPWGAIVVIMIAVMGWSVAPYIFTGIGGYGMRALVLVLFGMAWVNGWISSHFHYKMPYGGVVAVHGTVADIIYKNGKTRYVLANTRAVRLKDKERALDSTVLRHMADVPEMHIGGVFDERFTPNIGDKIMGKGIIIPNFSPDFVGGFSVVRYLLERGMIGYVNSPKKYASSWSVDRGGVHDNWGIGTIQTGIAHIRHSILQNIKNSDYDNEPPNTVGPLKSIAIALIVGKRDFISDGDNRAIRDSGLAHVMAISGMHVGLLIAIVFFVIRRCLCFMPSLALRYDTKVLAVLIALPVAVFYVLISGMGIPAVRALGMAGLALLGVLFYRNAITVRIVVGIACAMMVYNPLWFMQAGFLLSFSAVLGLVVFAEFYSRWLRQRGDKKPFFTKGILGYGLGIFCASGIATVATLPTVVQYFGVFPLYGIIANMIVVPLVSLWVMPMAVLAVLVMALGLDGMMLSWMLGGMLAGIDVMMDVAYGVQSLPHAVMHLQAVPTVGYAVMMVAGIVGCLFISHKLMTKEAYGGAQGRAQGGAIHGDTIDGIGYRKPRNFMAYALMLIFVGGVFMAQLFPRPVVMVNKTATTYGVRSSALGGRGDIVIAGWTKTMHKDTIIASVAKQFSIAPHKVRPQKCDRKSVCLIPIAVPVWGDRWAVVSTLFSGTLLEDIFNPMRDIKNLVIVPHKMTAQQITDMCQLPENAIILAPKVYIDYGNCKIPVLGKADFANMGAVTLFWDTNGIKLVDDARDVVVGRQGSKSLPSIPLR